ncbi:hypothetical protein BDN71DRAFT_1514120 [Pleurotus eryngii]|uniref:Uncharacterized protein n=1 Tax=Pleurotus eryngii TaxID=5323 RepID=A0A9P5ZIL7_PLEER|nr:hypothetical protein BDN71DRAFT_1514120 [Pleurotus eryngii]
MPSVGLAVLVDNTDANFTFNSPWLLSLPEPIWLYGELGAATAFYGHADDQLQGSIDGTSPTYHSPSLQFQIYQPWFNFPELAVTCYDITLDFSTNSTPLQGRRILVDDSDTATNYTWAWIEESDQMFATGDGLQQISHGTSVHRSTKVADYVLFQFTGSSISVVQWQNSGRISTAYTLDSASSHTITIPSNEDRNLYTDQSNYLVYHTYQPHPRHHRHRNYRPAILPPRLHPLHRSLRQPRSDAHSGARRYPPWTPPRIVRTKKPFPEGAIVGAAVLFALVAFLMYRMQKCRRPKSSGKCPEIDPLPERVVRPFEPPS